MRAPSAPVGGPASGADASRQEFTQKQDPCLVSRPVPQQACTSDKQQTMTL